MAENFAMNCLIHLRTANEFMSKGIVADHLPDLLSVVAACAESEDLNLARPEEKHNKHHMHDMSSLNKQSKHEGYTLPNQWYADQQSELLADHSPQQEHLKSISNLPGHGQPQLHRNLSVGKTESFLTNATKGGTSTLNNQMPSCMMSRSTLSNRTKKVG